MTVLENIGRVRAAKHRCNEVENNKKQMGITISKSMPDEITTEDRYQEIFSVGLDAKRPKLKPSGSGYEMVPSTGKIIGTTLILLAGSVGAGYLSYDFFTREDPDYFSGAVAALAALGSAAMVTPKEFPLP
tara:strand:- start:5505 stop:5897 length:393 start_codon:yes stop_codon:yes gene_type:complete